MATAVGSATAPAAKSGADEVFGSMGSETFLKLLVAQMKYQNPMSPSDPTAMMGQIATYAQVEALNKLQSLQASGNSLAEAQIATSMIGQNVTTTDSTGAAMTGKVTAARFTDAGPVLVLDSGAELSVSAIGRIGSSTAAAATPTPATATAAAAAAAAAGTTPAPTTPAATTPATGTTPATDTATTPATATATTPATTTPVAGTSSTSDSTTDTGSSGQGGTTTTTTTTP